MWGWSPHFFVLRNLGVQHVGEIDRALAQVIETELNVLEFDLVELRRGGSKSRPVVEVRIDRRDGVKVTLDDCTRVSRALEAQLDASDLVTGRYVLEVSSPGADRPLRTLADWRRFVGRRADVTCSPLPGGRAEVEILAVDDAHDEEAVRVQDAKGAEHRLPLRAITQARLAFHWKR